jgi:outer membrane protein insertion porin family
MNNEWQEVHWKVLHKLRFGPRDANVRIIGRTLLLSISIYFWFFLFFSPCESATISKLEIKGLSSIGEKELLDLMGMRVGGEVNDEIVREGIKRAFLKGLFEDITVRVPDGESPIVEINIKERDFINKIYVGGDHSVSRKLMKELFLLKEDDVMRYDLIETAIAQLKLQLTRYGFPESNAVVVIEKTDKPYRVNVRLRVDTGVSPVVKDIKINIVPPYPVLAKVEALSRIMNTSVEHAFSQIKLENDLKNMKEYFKKQGYYNPLVGPYSFEEGELEITINPGKHMTIAIKGNSAISTKSLLREAPFFEIEDFNDELVGEAVDKMLSLYHKEGYPFARIVPVINSDEGNLDISFFVYEGERIKVRTITIGGITPSFKNLKDIMALREGEYYNPELIETDKDSIREFYGSLGYIDVQVKDIEAKIDKVSKTAEIVVEIEEGKKTEVESVEISGVDADTKSKLTALLGIKPGSPYNEVDISDARFRILEYFDNNGYPNVDVNIVRNIRDYRASILFKVEEGKKRFFGKTVIMGNKQTKYEVINRQLINKEGQPYSFRSLAEDRQKLYRLGLFTDTEIQTMDAGGDKEDVLMKVTEGDAGSVDFGFGYGDYEKFRGFSEISYKNLWGTNREVLFRIDLSTLDKRFILQYEEPWFMGINLPFRVFYIYESKEELNVANDEILYRLDRYGVTAGSEKKVSNTVKIALDYEFSFVKTFDVQPDVVLSREDTGTLAISGIKSALVYDTRDNPIDPKKGILAGIEAKWATFLLFSETNFVKFQVYANNYQKLTNMITLATSVRGGAAFGYRNTDELPIVERFFLGGRSTVRGYDQDTLGPKGADGNPTGGNAFLMGNIEFRTSIGKGIGLVPFIDMGNVWVNAGDVNPKDLKYATGLGLRYSTPVGPLSVDYGFKLNRQPGESRGEIDFSIGQAF